MSRKQESVTFSLSFKTKGATPRSNKMPKKNYFAQNSYNDNRHRARAFWNLEEAEEWLKNNGGGTVKKRYAGVAYVLGEPIRVWGEVSHIPPTKEN